MKGYFFKMIMNFTKALSLKTLMFQQTKNIHISSNTESIADLLKHCFKKYIN